MSFAESEKKATSEPAIKAVRINNKKIINPSPICAFEVNEAVSKGESKFVYDESGSNGV